ncbi:hypothetical protein HDU79_007838 [Rhizoclosmatium sp. JEL0117]|nr:hypothetical protein HDU79_007838 [Rhizoclosmatium sp. JEL0117]
MSCLAYIVDTTEPLKRTKYFMYLDSVLALSACLAPLLSGLIAKEYGFTTVFTIQLILSCLLLVHLTLFFPSIPAKPHGDNKSIQQVFTDSVKGTITTVGAISQFPASVTLIIILIALAILTSGLQVRFLFYPAKRFGWDSLDVGSFVFFGSFLKITWLVGVLPRLMRWIGGEKVATEVFVLRVGIWFSVMGEIGYALAPNGVVFTGVAVLYSVGSVVAPTVRSLLSTMVSPSHQGRLLGSIQIFESVSALFASVAVSVLYQMTVGSFPQAVFFGMAIVMTVAATTSLLFLSKEGVAAMEMGAMPLLSSEVESSDETTEETPLLQP